MERRQFLKTTGLFAGLPLVSMFQSSIANAEANENNWKLLVENAYGKVFFQVLWTDIPGLLPENIEKLSLVVGASAILYRFTANFPVRGHWHPKGEYAFVIKGYGTNGDVTTYAGQDSYMPPGSYHQPGKIGPEGMDLFIFTPAPVDYMTPAPANKIDQPTDNIDYWP